MLTHATSFVAPKGGRVHRIEILVDPARPWQEAINAAGPDTARDAAIRRVDDQYPPEAGARANRKMVLVSFCKVLDGLQPVFEWAAPYGLVPEKPRSVFAIGEHEPWLRLQLGQKALVVFSLATCPYDGGRYMPCIWTFDLKRYTEISWSGGHFSEICWFAFSQGVQG